MNENHRKKTNRGGVLLELAITLPLVLFIAFAGLELARALKYSEIASSLSREAANLGYRDCTGDVSPKLRHCLNFVRDVVESYATPLGVSAQVVVSVYLTDPNTGLLTEAVHSDILASENPTKFSAAVGDSDVSGLQSGFVTSQRVVAIGEVYVYSPPVIPLIGQVLGASNRWVYDVSIF